MHPSYGDAWIEFNFIHPNFAANPRNIQLGLCINGFSLFNMVSNVYSCWPVNMSIYNLSHWKCMTRPFILLEMIIHWLKNLGKKTSMFS